MEPINWRSAGRDQRAGIRSIRHAGLRRLWERADDHRVPPELVGRFGSILTGIDDVGSTVDLAGIPSIHRLTGPLAGYCSVRVDLHKRIIFRFEGGDAREIDFVNHHQGVMAEPTSVPMRMRNPSHPDRVIRDPGFAEGTQPAAMAERLGLGLAELEPVLAAQAPLTRSLALALEAAGISSASFWMRLQGSYGLAQERLRRERTGEGYSGLAAATARNPESEPELAAASRSESAD